VHIRLRFLLAGALAALAVAGCSSAPVEDVKSGEPKAAGSAMTAAPEGAPEGATAQAQNLAEQAEKVMLDPAVPPREKYPQALKMFREALQLDPNNALAKDGIKLIEDIYKSMGRPVPE
jgi:tetratricopeptide (TPR) repeat protein